MSDPTRLASFSFDFRIAYADTDRMGVVYYANYLTLFERGRTELMRNMGLRYRDLEEKEKVFLPVSELSALRLDPSMAKGRMSPRRRSESPGAAGCGSVAGCRRCRQRPCERR